MHCARCGREADLQAGPDGGLYCLDCYQQVSKPQCIDCIKCRQRVCGDAVLACPFCPYSSASDVEIFENNLKKIAEPLRMEEKCERCGGSFHGRVFVLHGKALCRNCLVYEQDRWEIVPAKPGKGGTRVKIVIDKPKKPGAMPDDSSLGKRLFHSIGVDPDDPPPDPFSLARMMEEKRMADDACRNCDAYAKGKKRGKFFDGMIQEGKK